MNPSTAQARVIVDELVRHGVRDAVLAPGSRSAPLAYALHDADAAGRVRLHVRVDERSAAFLALGLARSTGAPVPVVTTSGTAVANLHPAVLEAAHALVPLVVLSCDRPPELRGTGANQTTHQPGLFGDAVRLAVDLGVAQDLPGQAASWRGQVSRAVAAALGSLGTDPGPVQLNVPFRDPLTPDLDDAPRLDEVGGGVAGDVGGWCEPLAGRPDGAPWTALPAPLRRRAQSVGDDPRTVVVLGDMPDPDLALAACEQAHLAGWPVVAEPFGRVCPTVLPHGPLLLTTDWWRDHAPRRVLVVGRPTLSRPVAALLRHPGVRVEVVTAGAAWPDPGHRAAAVHALDSYLACLPGERDDDDRAWSAAWADAGARVAAAVRPLLDEEGTGVAVARALVDALPSGAVLFAGPSNPARDLDVAAARRADVAVVANRGLAGIDGCVSTALGHALGSGASTFALVGDLTFCHDANALLVGPDEPRAPLTVIVPNDDGGGIFTTLEHGEPRRAATFERIFGTPTGTSLADLARAHGARHVAAASTQDVVRAVREPADGITVVEVRVDRARHRAVHARLREAAAAALAR